VKCGGGKRGGVSCRKKQVLCTESTKQHAQ